MVFFQQKWKNLGEEEELHKRVDGVREQISVKKQLKQQRKRKNIDGSVERTVVCFASFLRTFHANEEEEEEEPYLKS